MEVCLANDSNTLSLARRPFGSRQNYNRRFVVETEKDLIKLMSMDECKTHEV